MSERECVCKCYVCVRKRRGGGRGGGGERGGESVSVRVDNRQVI